MMNYYIPLYLQGNGKGRRMEGRKEEREEGGRKGEREGVKE